MVWRSGSGVDAPFLFCGTIEQVFRTEMNEKGRNMDDLRTKLASLDQKRQAYVLARSKAKTKTEAYRESGVSKTTALGWSDIDELDDLASALRTDRVLMVDQRLNEVVEEVVEELIKLARNARSEMVKLMAIKEILERVIGPVTAKVDLTSDGEKVSPIINNMMALFQAMGQLEQNKRHESDTISE